MYKMRLVDRYEEIAYGEVRAAADRWGLSVYPKVRVADVISLDAIGATGEIRRYGLQAHFDFIICSNHWDPVYAIEFDGRSHSASKQVVRDAKKDKLCDRACLPILRINSRYLTKEFGNLSLLTWIMDVYELQKGFYAAQERGEIPDNEPFDPFLLMSVSANEEPFPYWLSAKPRIKLQNLHKQGHLLDRGTSGLIGYDDKNGVMKGIEYIRVTAAQGIMVQSAMRPQQFPIILSDLLAEILSVQLTERVVGWLRGEVKAMPMGQIYSIAKSMRVGLRCVQAHSYGHHPDRD